MKTLAIEPLKCNGCRICEGYCSLFHEGVIWPEKSRVRIAAENDNGPFDILLCRQCEHAECISACAFETISYDAVSGLVVINTGNCEGCEACVFACSYKAMFFDLSAMKSYKCDFCGGDPECAKVCPTGAITLVMG